jgi:SAM-dependent methyltransferase
MTANLEQARRLDVASLEQQVKAMYRNVALEPQGKFHFEMGRGLTERLGYAPEDLDAIPAQAIDSFAGVGYYFDLAALRPGETVVDLGSGSGTDAFVAALKVGSRGRVIGIDMTDEQLAKAERLRAAARLDQVSFRKAYIQATGLDAACCDALISNGVINLAPDKAAVFREAARLLKPGGRMALSDIVTEVKLHEGITCNATLWAACIAAPCRSTSTCARSSRPGSACARCATTPNTASSPRTPGARQRSTASRASRWSQ